MPAENSVVKKNVHAQKLTGNFLRGLGMKCLAEFLLDSDLVLEEGMPHVLFTLADESFSIKIKNSDLVPAEDRGVLLAELVFEIDDFENAKLMASSKLAIVLNSLSFTTNRKFRLVRILKIIDWTPGLVDRRAIVYCEADVWAEAEPALDQSFTETAGNLISSMQNEQIQTALRWYRLGISAENTEEQFSYFWFALEIASAAQKGKDKIPSSCPHCRGALFCPACQKEPMHRRFASEAVTFMIHRVLSEDRKHAQDVCETLLAIRNELMHGGRIANVKLPCTPEEALSRLAVVTWHAIALWIDLPSADFELHFGEVENFSRRKIIASAHVIVQMGGDAENPKLEDFPHVETELVPLPLSRHKSD